MADATKKKRILGGHKALCTSVIKEVNKLVEQYSPEIEAKLKERKIVLTEKLETLNKLDELLKMRKQTEKLTKLEISVPLYIRPSLKLTIL